jgi:hypothetical protein
VIGTRYLLQRLPLFDYVIVVRLEFQHTLLYAQRKSLCLFPSRALFRSN